MNSPRNYQNDQLYSVIENTIFTAHNRGLIRLDHGVDMTKLSEFIMRRLDDAGVLRDNLKAVVRDKNGNIIGMQG